MLLYALIFLVAYLLGSIPFGLIISKVGFSRDLRTYGSGNIGTTNAFRALGKVGGALTFFADTLKGYLGGLFALVFVAAISGGNVGAFLWASLTPAFAPTSNAVPVGVALLAGVLGHLFSPWLKFKGGKGVAVAAGCLFVLFGWVPGFIEIAVFAIVVLVSRYVSLGSLAAAAACPVIGTIMFWGNWVPILFCLCACALVFWAHRENIARLRAGNERRVGQKKPQ